MPEPVPNPPPSPRSYAVAWAVVAVAGVLVGWWLWARLFGPPSLSGPVAGAPSWSAACLVGDGDPRPCEISFAKSSVEALEQEARNPVRVTGRRMRVEVSVADVRGVPGVDPGDRVRVVGTVTHFGPGRVGLEAGVVEAITGQRRSVEELGRETTRDLPDRPPPGDREGGRPG